MPESSLPNLGHRYQCVRELGSGASGRVFLVEDDVLGKQLALKLLRDENPNANAVSRLSHEFTTLSRLAHSGIARAFDFGFVESTPYFTSEYVDGQSLGHVENNFETERLWAICSELAETLAFLHENSVLHLDVKPSNVVCPGDENRGNAVLVDFGLCRESPVHSDKVGHGSLPYMAPEYFRSARLGPWTDIYALGVTLYKLGTGEVPRRAVTALDDMRSWDPFLIPPSKLEPTLPPEFDHLVLKCLALEPKARYRHAQDLLNAVRRTIGTDKAQFRRSLVSSTVGRKEEFNAIQTFTAGIRETASEESPILLLAGEAGSGLTHVLQSAKTQAQTSGLPFYLETGYAGRVTAPADALRCFALHIPDHEPETAERWIGFIQKLKSQRPESRNEISEAERRARRAAEVTLAASSLEGPFVLAIDGLQHFDEISIGLVGDLIRFLGEAPPHDRPKLGVILSFRTEGPSRELLREISEYILTSKSFATVTLRPLNLPDSARLYAQLQCATSDDINDFELFQNTKGNPGRIVALAAGRTHPATNSPAAAPLDPNNVVGREILLALHVLRRPSTCSELCRLIDLPELDALRSLSSLADSGLLQRTRTDEETEWSLRTNASEMISTVTETEKRMVCAQLAIRLQEKARDIGDPRRIEAIRLFARARESERVVELGLPVARFLKSCFQSRAALEIYESVLEFLPHAITSTRLEIEIEIAELHARVGDLDRGIERLEHLREKSQGALSPADWRRLTLWSATLRCRKGDYSRAQSLFAEGFADQNDLSRREQLFFINERAVMATFSGDSAAAEKLCEEGFALAENQSDHRVRETVLNLHATRANIALRRFDYEHAIADFRHAISISEAIGSPASTAVILNNLGIVLSNSDHYEEAVDAFRDAEKTCLRLDEGPSLISIYCNLTALFAKLGRGAECSEYLRKAEILRPATLGKRQELYLHHCRGLVDFYRGRYSKALENLARSASIAQETGDVLISAFDQLYSAESLIFLGRYEEARQTLERIQELDMPPRVSKMAHARLALLSSLERNFSAQADAVRAFDQESKARPVPFLDCWDGLLVAWSESIAGCCQSSNLSSDRFETSLQFFETHGLRPAHALSIAVRAECSMLQGKHDAALTRLDDFDRGAHSLADVLSSLVEARCRIENDQEPEALHQVANLLSDAGSELIGSELTEWSYLHSSLRSALSEESSLTLRTDHDEYRNAWLSFSRRLPSLAGAPADAPNEDSATVPLLDRTAGRGAGHRLIAQSPAMQKVAQQLSALGDRDLPTLIRGEIGVGKELVAQAIHDSSARRDHSFTVLSAASIPIGLLDVELFGAVEGSYTDQGSSREGILANANGGTVLIDEFTELSLEGQTKLLRVMSSGRYRPVGAESERELDVRFLFTTSQDPDAAVLEGRLRSDFLHRARVLEIAVPPLRSRREDLATLVDVFLEEDEGPPLRVDENAIQHLTSRHWPGNVRELRNLIARLRLDATGTITEKAVREIAPDDAPLFPENILSSRDLSDLQQNLEKAFVEYHLTRLDGDTTELATLLGISRQQLYRRCRKLGISLRDR